MLISGPISLQSDNQDFRELERLHRLHAGSSTFAPDTVVVLDMCGVVVESVDAVGHSQVRLSGGHDGWDVQEGVKRINFVAALLAFERAAAVSEEHFLDF